MYDYRPPRKNRTAHLLVLLLMVLSLAAFLSSAWVRELAFIPQIVGLCLLVPAIQLTARYIAVQYLYRLRETEDGIDLEVYSYRGGDHMQLVCRVGQNEITDAAPLTEENKKPPHGTVRYNYCPDIHPVNALLLFVSNYDGECEVLLSPDDRIREVLTSVYGKNGEKEGEHNA